jgi:hypothetical protein
MASATLAAEATKLIKERVSLMEKLRLSRVTGLARLGGSSVNLGIWSQRPYERFYGRLLCVARGRRCSTSNYLSHQRNRSRLFSD